MSRSVVWAVGADLVAPAWENMSLVGAEAGSRSFYCCGLVLEVSVGIVLLLSLSVRCPNRGGKAVTWWFRSYIFAVGCCHRRVGGIVSRDR